jgi:anaerobic dimethyl sulfoxide reductase subunit B (iron-sulfur subunit)
MAKQLAFYFDASACADCKACQIACKEKNDLPIGVLWRRVYQYEGGSWTESPDFKGIMVPNNVFSYSLSIACMHCGKPLCADICPTAAITKNDDGIVLIDADKCIGCRYCEWACPYDAPQFNEELGVMTKCDFCQDLLAQGLNPACVDNCVMRCLDYGDINELRAKYGNLAEVEPLPKADITEPAFVVTPHKFTQKSGQGTGRISNLPEEL